MAGTTFKIGDILSHLLRKARISEAALARNIGIPRATINRVVSGKTPDPRASTLKAIAEYLGVTVDQLVGKEPLVDDNRPTLSTKIYAPIPLIKWEEATNWKQSIKRLKLGDEMEWIAVDPKVGNEKFALKIEGDSMWPQFRENTVLVVDPNKTPKNRDFVIVYIHKSNEVLFRQLLLDGSYKFVKAINEIFPNIQLSGSDTILGVVIQTRNNLE